MSQSKWTSDIVNVDKITQTWNMWNKFITLIIYVFNVWLAFYNCERSTKSLPKMVKKLNG